MSKFNFDAYLSSRLAETEINSKIDQVERASAAKKVALEQRHQAQAASWAGKLGLDSGSFVGNRVNDVASLVSGASRLAGHVISLPVSASGVDNTLPATQEDIDAYNRYTAGQATPTDAALLERKPSAAGPTMMERFQTGDRARAAARGINDTFNLEKIVDPTNRAGLSEDLAKNFQPNWDKVKSGNAGDMASGLAGLLVNAGSALLSNPSAVREYILENLPQLAVGAVGKVGQGVMAASNAGYAIDTFQKGMENYAAANNGQLPPIEVQQTMALQAASLALAEQAGDVFTLGATKVAKDATRSAFKSALNVGKAGAKGFASEAPTEGYQTYMEGEITGKPASALEVYSGAVIGGAAGGGLSSGGAAIGELLAPPSTNTTPGKAKGGAASPAADPATKKLLEEAIASGDVTALTDPKSPSYSPSTAVAALHGHSQKEDVTDEVKASNLDKATKIVTDLEESKVASEDKLAEINAEAESYKTKLAAAKTALKGMSSSDPQYAITKERIALYQEGLAELPKDALHVQNEINRYARELKSSNEVLGNMTSLVQGKKVVDASNVIVLAMSSPELVSDAQAAALADDESNGLTAEQRTYLRSMSKARIAENKTQSLGSVSDMIVNGDEKTGNLGIVQYRQAVNTALRAGNKKLAERHMTGLEKFAASHNLKAEAINEAFEDGGAHQIIRLKDGSWVRSIQKFTKQQKAENGAVTIHKGSGRLVESTAMEAATLNDAVAEMRAAYAIKFPKTGAKNVSNDSQQGSGTQAPATAKPVQATEASGVSATASTDGASERSGDAGKPSDVEAAGVVQSTQEPSGSPVVQEEKKQTKGAETQSTSESTVEASAEPDGKLTLMANKSPEGTAYRARNLVADFFKQDAGKETDASVRPLVAVKDFLNGLKKSVVLQFLKVEDLTDRQKNLLIQFKSTAADWAKQIQLNLPGPSSPEYWHKDMMQFLVQDQEGTRQLDSNVVTAMVYAGYSWVVENAVRPQYNDSEAINDILDRDETHLVSVEEQNLLANAGMRQGVVVNALGQRALQALGLRAIKGAPLNLQPELEAAVGGHIFKLLMDAGIVERVTLTGDQMAYLTGDAGTDTNAAFQFVKLARNAEGDLNAAALDLLTTSKGTGGVLDKLFGVEPGMKAPSFEPNSFTQKTTKNTQQGIPSKLAKVMEQQGSVGSQVKQSLWDLWSQFELEDLVEMAGGENLEGRHTYFGMSAKAKNDGLRREIENFNEFVDQMEKDGKLDADLYFEYSVWKQQRVGIATNMINPQSSKVARHMLSRKSWDTEVDPDNKDSLENFKLRVMEGLGVKTDKQGNEKSLSGFDAMFDPALHNGATEESTKAKKKAAARNAAVDVMVQRLRGKELSDADKHAVMDGVKAGGENFHSLDALMAMAQYRHAKGSKFTTQLMGEVDGVTNGPMLTHLLMGAASSVKDLFGLLNRGGFYEQGSEHQNYNLWREAAGHFDLYETTALHMTQTVRRFIRDGIFKDTRKGRVQIMSGPRANAVMGAIYSFTGELADKDGKVQKAGRNIVKTPLTGVVFGSPVQKGSDSMANNFVESIYSKIEDSFNGSSTMDADDIVNNINRLLSEGSFKRNGEWVKASLLPRLTIEQLMKKEFTSDQVKGIKAAFKTTLGQAVEDTLNEDFGTFISQRKTFNDTAQLAFKLYNSVYEAMREKLIADLVESGEIEHRLVYQKGADGKADKTKPQIKEAIHDLTAAQEAGLREQLKYLDPVMHTPMSKDSGSLKTGMLIAKNKRKLSQKTTYTNVVKFGTPFQDNGAKSTTVHGYENVEVDPGVAMLVTSIHSADSAAMHSDIKDELNVHDARGVGVGGFKAAAQSLNKTLWSTMLNYSPASEIYAALERTVLGLANIEMTPEVVKSTAKTLSDFAAKMEMEPDTALNDMGRMAKRLAFRADTIKLETMEQMGYIDQYAFQGGQYEVTDKDRAAAKAQREQLSQEVDKETLAAVEKIMTALNKAVTKEPAPAPNPEEDVAVKPIASSPFGKLGKPVKVEAEVVKFFEEKNERTAKEVMLFLSSKVIGHPFQRKLLQALYKVVDPSMPVVLVTPETQEHQVLAKPDRDVFAWYAASQRDSAVYIKSAAFVNSGLRVETLLHELVHAATMRAIGSGMSTTKLYVQELNALLTSARAYVKSKGLTQYDNAVANIDELVAYGMTSQAFQKEVLENVRIQSTTFGRMRGGMQAFVSNLAALLGFKDVASANGLGVLITNVSGLLEHTAAMNDGPTEVRAQASVMGEVNTYSTMDIHNALENSNGSVTPEFQSHLRNLLGGIVRSLHGAFGSFKAELMENQAISPMDVWMKAVDTGKAPFTSKINASGFHISDQESFVSDQVEATMRAALTANEAHSKMAYKELSDLYTETYSRLKPSDFSSQALYDFVFKIEKSGGDRSDYLARFAALGLANQEFNALLKVATERNARKASDAKSFAERLQIIFENVLEFFQTKVTHTYQGQRADVKLQTLVEQLVDIEAKKRFTLARRATETSIFDPIEKGAKAAADKVRQKVADVADSDYLRNHTNVFVKAASGVLSTYANDRVEAYMEHLAKFRDSQFKGRQGIVAGLLTAVRGPKEIFMDLLLQSKNNERNRKAFITTTGKFAMESFVNGGRDLTREGKAAITAVFLRTGAHVLLTNKVMDLAELENVIGDQAARNAAILALENQLTSYGDTKYYFIEQANALGYYKATGKVRNAMMMMNAHNIARLFNTGEQQLNQDKTDSAEKIIESLIALYSLDYASPQSRQDAKTVLHAENLRTDGNGIEYVLRQHALFERESLARLFAGKKVLMMHGYTPEIYNPHIEVVAANATEGVELQRLGWVKGAALALDPTDPDRELKHIYVLRDGGLQPHLTGIIAYDGKKAKGTRKHSGHLDLATSGGIVNQRKQDEITDNPQRQALIARMFKPGPRRDLTKAEQTFLAPVVNEHGTLVNWRYLMQEDTKNTILERDNRFEKVLGSLAGSIVGKETARAQNENVMSVLKEQYEAEYATNKDSYVNIGPKSPDPEMREMWALLSKETKEDIRQIWGRDEIVVRSDSLDIVFGYRKLSLTSMFDLDPADRNKLEEILVHFAEVFMGGKAKLRVGQFERGWQEFVSEAKDIIVVKSGLVMLGNIYSNLWELGLLGVPIKDSLHHHLVALKAATAHSKDSEELLRLRAKLKSGYTQGNADQIERQILRLEDSISRNPVNDLIQAGLMPTIVEDVAADDDIYSYKGQLAHKTEGLISKLHPGVVTAGKFVYMAHDTKLYQGLSRITQLSDFVARYTLYQHMISRKDNPLTKKQAIMEANEAFVNYDVPMHRGLQYADDMGIMMFTKYFLRIQKVLMKIMRDHPARVLSAVMLNMFMDLGPTVLSSSAMTKLGNNPLQSGAFKFIDSWDDLGTVRAAMTLIK